MVSSVEHHLALGIHPGAYVQDTEPNTTQIQHRTLWVDTSTDEPYALKYWDAIAGLWRFIGGQHGAIEIYDRSVLADGPIAYLPLNDATSLAVDLTGLGHDGTPSGGVAYQSGSTPDGSPAMQFDGSSGYLVLANPTTLPSGNHAFTQEGWFNCAAARGNLVSWGETSGLSGRSPSLRILSQFVVDPYFSGHDLITPVSGLNGEWHHFAVTYDGTTRLAFIDAVQVNADTPSGINMANVVATIGCQVPSFPSEFFFGLMARVAIYDKALSPARLAAHHTLGSSTGGSGGSGTGLTGDCLVYPKGAQVCNDDVDVVRIKTPTGEWQLTPTALIWPFGHRLEQIP